MTDDATELYVSGVSGCSSRVLSNICLAYVRPILTYGHPLITGTNPQQLETLSRTQRRISSCRIAHRTPIRTSSQYLYRVATFPPLQEFLAKLNSGYKDSSQHCCSILMPAVTLINNLAKPNSSRSSIPLNQLLPAQTQT